MAIMDMEQWNDLTRNIIGAGADQAVLTGILSTATQDYGELFADHASLKDRLEQIEKDNEALRQANMSLFMQVTESKKQEFGGSTENNKENKTSRAETITIEDLFKEEK